MTRRLKCSFCGKDETQVAKLVAGGKRNMLLAHAYICDGCVSIAYDIMSNTDPPTPAAAARQCRSSNRTLRAVGSPCNTARLSIPRMVDPPLGKLSS